VLDLAEQFGEESGVGRVLLDVLEHRPAVAGGNAADRLADGEAGALRLAVDVSPRSASASSSSSGCAPRLCCSLWGPSGYEEAKCARDSGGNTASGPI